MSEDDEVEIRDQWSMWTDPIGHLPSHDDTVENWYATPERAAKLQSMPYAEYLETPEWHYRRRQVVKAAERKCQYCGIPTHDLNVHHRTYERLGNEDPDDLIALCRDCHEREHARPR
jgi:5-methylcytosine-specific restriction endonuclease McrA